MGGDLLELLAEKREAQGDDQAMTRLEIQEKMGWSDKKTLQELRRLVNEGKAVCVYVQRPSITGTLARRPAYRLKENGNDGQ